jgi:hypothetical protein
MVAPFNEFVLNGLKPATDGVKAHPPLTAHHGVEK